MVLGRNKSQMIAGSWLLTEYKNIFETVLNSGGVKLLVMGYSFCDKHINEIIATAVSRHQCKIFIWNPEHPLDLLREHGAILNGLIGWEPRPIIDIMPAIGPIHMADSANEIFPDFFSLG